MKARYCFSNLINLAIVQECKNGVEWRNECILSQTVCDGEQDCAGTIHVDQMEKNVVSNGTFLNYS
jgi:hypothetical protein